VVGLERALQNYTLDLSPSKPFDIKTVPIDTQPMAEQRPSTAPGGLGTHGESPRDKKVGITVT